MSFSTLHSSHAAEKKRRAKGLPISEQDMVVGDETMLHGASGQGSAPGHMGDGDNRQ